MKKQDCKAMSFKMQNLKALNPKYWNERYRHGNTPWDMGQVSPPLRNYLDANTTPDTRILIPGAGRAYEAAYLHERGYQQVYVCDWAPAAFERLQDVAPGFPRDHLLVEDFFELDPAYDLILEQTFFSAIDPSLRPRYVAHTRELLVTGGRLAGVLFAHEFDFEGPPFGGTMAEYLQLFEPYFEIRRLEMAQDSIAPRLGREVFLEVVRQD